MTREGLPTGTVTLMFTDIEGSTVLQERLKERWRWVLETHNALLRQCFERFHGFEVKNLGDGFLVAFTNAKEAIECAIALQQAIAQQDWGEEVGELKVRVGMDTGEPFIIVDAQSRPDYYGVTVSRARQICEAGYGGQILISHATWQAVKDALPKDVELRELGAFRLKGLKGWRQIFQVYHPTLPYQFTTPSVNGGLSQQLTDSVNQFHRQRKRDGGNQGAIETGSVGDTDGDGRLWKDTIGIGSGDGSYGRVSRRCLVGGVGAIEGDRTCGADSSVGFGGEGRGTATAP